MKQRPASAPQCSASSFLPLAFFLLLSTGLSLLWSHLRLMWNDEFLSFYTDGATTFKQVILIQLHYPISLDPPTYHLLSHLCMEVLGRNAIALRLPALAGFLLFQLCLFFFVRRIASDRSAVLAMAVPLLTASFRYSVEGRPYGLLLGLYALALLCWQVATEGNTGDRWRLLSLVGLASAIALAVTSHYFGVLILVPVSLAELTRTFVRKRLDVGVVTAIVVGMTSVAILFPFQHAVTMYRRHYYITGVNIHDISQGYRELFVRYTTWPMVLQKMAAGVMVALALTLAYAAYRRFKHRPATEHVCTWMALGGLALLPFFGYLFGRFVTHTMEVRYVIAALIAFAATFGIVLERKLRSNAFYYSALALVTAAALAINAHNILQERNTSSAIMASLYPSPALASALAANTDAHLYEQSLGNFFVDSYYTPDLNLRSRITLLYNAPREISFLQHDTYSIAAANLQHFTALPVVNYDQVAATPGPHLVIQWQDGWNWTDKAAALENASVTPLGPSFGGQAVSLMWP